MLTEICAEIRNYFLAESSGSIHSGEFVIANGGIMPLDFLKEGQYFRIVGSALNDGVYQYNNDLKLTDEVFVGAVWAMNVPPAFIALADEIKKFCESDSGAASPYTSESFGGYSYSKATDSNGIPLTWQSVFAKRLNKYRRISVL
jgi:hypothetical protein